jgi:hypothetical protein
VDVWDKTPLPPPEDGQRVDGADPTAAAEGGSGSGDGPPTDTGDEPSGDETPWWSKRIANVPAWLLLLLAIVVGVGIIAALVLPGDSDDGAQSADVDVTIGVTPTTSDVAVVSVVTAEPVTSEPATPTVPATSEPPVATTGTSTSTVPATTVPATTVPATTVPATTVPATTVPATTVPATTVPATTVPATTVPAPAGISGPTTATGANGETLTVTPRQGPCRYGPDCFVASFTIAGFATQPDEFVCEFSSGARYVFRFSSAGADPACSTLDVPDSIVVEVGGLRTEPVTISRGD